MPTLSIVIPLYNMAEWVAVTLESCLQQSHKELEILVLDDGSTDVGPDIARAYAALDSRIRVISQPNAGLGGARQNGQDAAGGDYITWLDADDFLSPTAAASWLAAAEKDGSDLVCGNALAFSSRTFNARRYFYHTAATGLHFDTAPQYWKSKVVWRWIFSLDLIRRAGIRHAHFKLGQDVCFMYEMLLRAERFAQVEPNVYYFRQEHKSAHASLETQVEHSLAHFAEVKRILLHPPDGRARIKPLIKYLNENYWRDIKKTAPRLSGPDDHYEKRLIDLGFALFDGLAPDWFRAAALAPEVKEQTDFLPLAKAMIRRDREAVQGILENLRRTAVSAPDKRNVFHTIRHNLKSVLNPLAWEARNHLRALESLAAKRKGIPRVTPGGVARPAR